MVYESHHSISNMRQPHGRISKKWIFEQIPHVIRWLDVQENL